MNAQTVLSKPPADAAPDANAPLELRESWCDARVSSLIAGAPGAPLPEDVRPTHRFETEFNSCKLDPQEYERQTRNEARGVTLPRPLRPADTP
jgi:hypothetical protein